MKIQTALFIMVLLLSYNLCTILNSVKSTLNLDINFNNETPSCFIQTQIRTKNKVRSLINSNQAVAVEAVPTTSNSNWDDDPDFENEDEVSSYLEEDVEIALKDGNSSMISINGFIISTVLLALF